MEEQSKTKFNKIWEGYIRSLIENRATVQKDKETLAWISIDERVQQDFANALGLLFIREVRRYCQEAVKSEDFVEK
jgi:hypothetical protein